MNKIQIQYTEKQRQILQGITSVSFDFALSDGRAINSILNDMNSKFNPYPKKDKYSSTLKYYQGNALVVICKILQKEHKQEPLILSTCTSLIQQIEPKL